MKSFFKKLIDKTILDRTFWKFVLVGVVNTLVGLGVNYLLLFLLPKWGMERNVAFWVASAAWAFAASRASAAAAASALAI